MCHNGTDGWIQDIVWKIAHQSRDVYRNGDNRFVFGGTVLCDPGKNAMDLDSFYISIESFSYKEIS